MSSHSTVITTSQYWMFAVWTGFLTACLLEGLVFSIVDPAHLHWPSYLIETPRQTTYTLAFFCFWLISIGCSGMAMWLAMPEKANLY